MAGEQTEKAQAALAAFIERTMRRLQVRAYQALTSGTPVDTGFARAWWAPSAGAPSFGPADRPQADVARAQAVAVFAQHQQASALLASGYRLTQGPIFIVNGVRYVVFLNQGTSAQAPAMFVEQAVQQAVDATQREIGGSP